MFLFILRSLGEAGFAQGGPMETKDQEPKRGPGWGTTERRQPEQAPKQPTENKPPADEKESARGLWDQ